MRGEHALRLRERLIPRRHVAVAERDPGELAVHARLDLRIGAAAREVERLPIPRARRL